MAYDKACANNEYQKDTCYIEIEQCIQTLLIIVRSIVKYNQEGLCDHLKRRRIIFTLTSSSVCISTPNLKLPWTSFVICSCLLVETILGPIQWPKLFMELEVPAIGLHNLVDNLENEG